MSTEKTAPKGAWAKFMHWYESYQGKRVVACVYSLGASVVIVGALFKIMHFPGAGPMLIVGMGVEAILFAIGCLDKPHAEFHWESVFPQLLGYGADPELLKELEQKARPTLLGAGEAAAQTPAAKVPALDEKALDSLKKGINDLAKTATQLSELGAVVEASNKLSGKMTEASAAVALATETYAEKLNVASGAADQFVQAGKVISEQGDALKVAYADVTTDLKKVAAGTKAYEAQVKAIAGQLNSLNAVYELQIKTLQAQVDAYKAQSAKVEAATAQVEALTAGVKTMTDTAVAAQKSQEAYAAGAKQLAAQVADLNKVYGHMLNALS